MKNMTHRTKKNISGYNGYNYTLKSDINQRKYFMKIIVTVVYFMVAYSHSIILCKETANNENSELTKSESPTPYCNVFIEADSIRIKAIVTVFDKRSKSRLFSCGRNSSEESYYKLIHHASLVYEVGLVQLYKDDLRARLAMSNVITFGIAYLKSKYINKKPLLVVALTAGLRLFNEESEAIVNRIKYSLNASQGYYQLNENPKLIMNESREGLYAWLTVNFMNNTLKNFNSTIAVLDLRDSSLQIIFYVPPENLSNYEAQFVKQYTIMGIERSFYNQSHLDLGLMEMRIKILTFNNDLSTYSSPCHRINHNFSYTYLFKNYNITGSSPKNDIYTQCLSAVQALIAKNVNKVIIEQPIMAISFFHETAKEANLISNTEKIITIKKFSKAAIKCFENAFAEYGLFNCIDLVYIYVLLSHLIDVGDNPTITVKKYDNISEISWALGAAYLKLPIIENNLT